jgi:hypothetical protein
MAAGARFGLNVMTALIGIPVSIATKKAIERAWRAARPGDPPRSPSEANVQWADALGWAVLSAVGVVLADLISRRSAEATYRALTGSEPPPGRPAKPSKKASAE